VLLLGARLVFVVVVAGAGVTATGGNGAPGTNIPLESPPLNKVTLPPETLGIVVEIIVVPVKAEPPDVVMVPTTGTNGDMTVIVLEDDEPPMISDPLGNVTCPPPFNAVFG
jgi:hypothetical protein